jgi:hypothetical protein
MNDKKQLPSLRDLYNGDLPLKTNQNKLNTLLNQPPNDKWVHKHPFATKEKLIDGRKVKVPIEYIPIERVEYLLTRLFIKWRVEVKQIQVIANSCVVTVRLHYQNIENDEWSWQDGIGAMPIQTERDHGAMDWNAVRTDAVMKSAPAAESYAIKDAAEKIGKIFGKDLNRKDEIGYDSLTAAFNDETDKIRDRRAGMDELLVRKATYDDDEKEIIYAKLADPSLPYLEYKEIMEEVKSNQPKIY